jgi:hypothetical protein
MNRAKTGKAHVFVRFPAELLKEIDAIAGPRKRSAFLAEILTAELERRNRIVAEKSKPRNADPSAPPPRRSRSE